MSSMPKQYVRTKPEDLPTLKKKKKYFIVLTSRRLQYIMP